MLNVRFAEYLVKQKEEAVKEKEIKVKAHGFVSSAGYIKRIVYLARFASKKGRNL